MDEVGEACRPFAVGFTGTRSGMTEAQLEEFKLALCKLVANHGQLEFHHGDCVGADAEAHDVVKLVSPNSSIIVHPPKDTSLRAYKQGDALLSPLTYLARNRAIVESIRLLIAAPLFMKETDGGTWYTVRYARRVGGRVVLVIWPDGSYTYEIPHI